jgi:hypothetical protein
MRKNYGNSLEVIFECTDILANPFMEYTKVELESAFNTQQTIYTASVIGSAPRRQSFNAMAHIEIAFDAYAKGIKQFDVFVDDSTSLRDVLEDSYEIAHGIDKTIEDMRRDVGIPGVVVVGNELLTTTVEKTKGFSRKASNTFFDGIFQATSWLNTKTDPSNRK